MIIIPKNYVSPYGIMDTERAIKLIKDTFETTLARALHLTRISAPLFVKRATGLNDDLNGVERPVSFEMKDAEGQTIEIIHSLAKWKRLALKRYGISLHEGIYTDMNAIRRDETLDNTHSIYVDQWDWESIISAQDRNEKFLHDIVRKIYRVFKDTENMINEKYAGYFSEKLPEEIFFISSEELLQKYPNLSPKEREIAICKEKKAVFIQGIGNELSNGEKHDLRSPDYDDWSLNGDILFYNPVHDTAIELSSMGIRVDEKSLMSQTEKAGTTDRLTLNYHKDLLDGKLPLTIGGGIGQSRICMYMLEKRHIGEVQSSVWDEKNIKKCQEMGIELL